jgi:aminopeptidase N
MEFPEVVFSASDPYVVAHEVAHQWWYSIVGNDQYSEPWLDESFATYAGQLVVGGFRYCNLPRPFKEIPRRFRNAALDRGMRYYDRRVFAYSLVVYDTGACVLRALERRIGRARMTAFLRLLVSRHRHGVVTKADVLAALAETVPGFDMKRFLRLSHLSA